MYVSGPMRGYPKFNFPVFDAVAAFLRSEGYDVDNPAEHDRETQPGIEQWDGFAEGDISRCPLFDYSTAMQWDLACVAQDQGIVLLPGWEASTGVRIERFVAEHTGSAIFLAHEYKPGRWGIKADPIRERMSVPAVKVAAMAVEA